MKTGFSLFRGVWGATIVKPGFGELALSNRGGLINGFLTLCFEVHRSILQGIRRPDMFGLHFSFSLLKYSFVRPKLSQKVMSQPGHDPCM